MTIPFAAKSGLQSAVTGAVSRFQALDVVSNNLANSNTVGFKRDVVSFEAALQRVGVDPDSTLNQIRLRETVTDQSSGAIKATGNSLDLAIDGPGFFQVETANGTFYTRQGTLSRDGQNRLVTSAGDPVLGEGGPITVTGDDIRIDADGTIMADGVSAGKIALFAFEAGTPLEKRGLGLFSPPAGIDPQRIDNPRMIQGSLEMSNVNVLQEMVRMVECQREFETFQKMIKTYNTLAGKADEIGSL